MCNFFNKNNIDGQLITETLLEQKNILLCKDQEDTYPNNPTIAIGMLKRIEKNSFSIISSVPLYVHYYTGKNKIKGTTVFCNKDAGDVDFNNIIRLIKD